MGQHIIIIRELTVTW